MEWRVANGLITLRGEVNARYPNRSKDSDGSIGDANHASRSSDHNPWIADPPGPHVVSAIDITHDPAGGFDSYAFAEWLRNKRDHRIKYVISNRKIFAGEQGQSPWNWRKYSGANPHDHHVHISIEDEKRLYDDISPWGVTAGLIIPHHEPMPPAVPRTLRSGASGPEVTRLQTLLGQHGIPVKMDSIFGMRTERAVVRYQQNIGLHADGIVGPQTWKSLLHV